MDNDLAIKNGSTKRKRTSFTDNAGIPLGPIESMAGIGTRLAALDHQQRAVAIVLDLMNPVGALRWLVGRGEELRLDKAEPIRTRAMNGV